MKYRTSLNLFLLLVLSVASVACTGKTTRDTVLIPAMSFVWHGGVFSDFDTGLSDAFSAGDITETELGFMLGQAEVFGAALTDGNRDLVAQNRSAWFSTFRPYAERGIQTRLDAGLIGSGGAAGRIERLDNFEDALNKAAERLD